jgi:hypothetical protein
MLEKRLRQTLPKFSRLVADFGQQEHLRIFGAGNNVTLPQPG